MVAAKRKSNATESVTEWATLEDLPNVGKAIAADFHVLGIRTPRQLRRKDPYALYERLNRLTGVRHDPCLLDTFIAAVRFVDGGPARPWWAYTAERKRELAARARGNGERKRRST
jgi:DNA transformation protein